MHKLIKIFILSKIMKNEKMLRNGYDNRITDNNTHGWVVYKKKKVKNMRSNN